MQIPHTPTQAAILLGVAPVTIYKWIETGKLAATTVRTGHVNRIYISQETIDLKRAELDYSVRDLTVFPPSPAEEMAWVQKHRDLFGSLPAMYRAYRRGIATFEQMKNEAVRRSRLLAE